MFYFLLLKFVVFMVLKLLLYIIIINEGGYLNKRE